MAHTLFVNNIMVPSSTRSAVFAAPQIVAESHRSVSNEVREGREERRRRRGIPRCSSTRWGLARPQRGGDRYEGIFGDGVKNGPGTFTFASGDRFKGDMKADAMNGKGTMLFNNGDRYVGGFSQGLMANGQYFRNPTMSR